MDSDGSRSFDFGSDDVLCSFDDYALQLVPAENGECLDSSAKELHENRGRSPSANLYEQSEELSREDVMYAVEKCMKKYADNLTLHLERISGRLTHLELYCYKLGRSIGEFHTDMILDQSEADLKLESLDKHVHEVHRSVQIIRDKQELSETQNELTKLQLSQKNSTNLSHSIKNNDDLSASTSDKKANYESNDVTNQQLALALQYQISSSPTSVAISPPDKNHPEKELPVQQSPPPVSHSVLPREHFVLNQADTYHYTHHQPLLMEQRSQIPQPELHYSQQSVKMQDFSVQTPPNHEQNAAASQLTQQQTFPQYQQHLSQPMQPQQPSSQAQSPRLQTPPAYLPCAPNQYANKLPESHQSGSILLPAPYFAAPHSGTYVGSSNYFSYLPPQHSMQQQQLLQASPVSFAPPPLLAKSSFVGTTTSTYPSQSNMLGCNPVYVIDGNRASHLQSCHLGTIPPNGNAAASLIPTTHPYVRIGYPRDHMVGVVFGTAESC